MLFVFATGPRLISEAAAKKKRDAAKQIDGDDMDMKVATKKMK